LKEEKLNIEKLIAPRARTTLLASCAAAWLAACGGGGNESEPYETMVASPSGVKVTGSPTACAVGPGPTVYVFGGQPPYRLSNSVPGAMMLDRSVLSDRGDGFAVTFINGACIEELPVVVVDANGQVLSVPFTNELGT
jgi:hypothetical protein